MRLLTLSEVDCLTVRRRVIIMIIVIMIMIMFRWRMRK